MDAKLNKALDEVIAEITSSMEYKKCLELKEKMSTNRELMDIIAKIKVMQKRYVRSNYDDVAKRELDQLEAKLNAIPIYVIYMQQLEKVNEKIDEVVSFFNDYFYKVLNGDN